MRANLFFSSSYVNSKTRFLKILKKISASSFIFNVSDSFLVLHISSSLVQVNKTANIIYFPTYKLKLFRYLF